MFDAEDYRYEELRQQSLMGNCQDIITGIGKLTSDDYQRAIWELVQNARDESSGESIIKIELHKDAFVFKHNGKAFDNKGLGALIMQNSAKSSNDDKKVGQYGTGFMITHILNHIVHIDGTFDDKDKEGKHIAYYPIDHFEINRDADTPEELLKKMTTALDAVLTIHKGQAIAEKREWTTFTYELDEDKAGVLDTHLNRIINYIPIVLILNKSIKEIVVCSDISGIHQSFSFGEDIRNEAISEIANWKLLRQSIIVTTSDSLDSVDILSLQSEKGHDVIIIPPYPTCLGNIKEMPSLFLNFPLLGTEQFGVNFIFHSKDFFPVEERNGIMLPHKSVQYPDKPQKNKEALTRMFEVLFAYYAEPLNADGLPIDCCRVEFVNNETSGDEELTSFYKELQQSWAKHICNWKIIPTSDNKRSSVEDHNVCVLDADFYHTLNEEDICKYENTIVTFASQTKLSNGEFVILPKDHVVDWSVIVRNWNIEEKKEYYVTLKEVCESINGKPKDLHNFLEWLNKIDSKSIYESLALIPNREGSLCFKSKLREGKTISQDLYQLARPILQGELDNLVDEQYADIFEFPEYTRSDLQNAMTTRTSALRKETFARQQNPISVENLEKGDDLLKALIEYCYIFPNVNAASLRKELVPVIYRIYKNDNVVLQPHIISNDGGYVNGSAIDIYESAFNYLLDNTLFVLSQKTPNWIIANKKIVLELLTLLKNRTNDQDHHKRLVNNAVFPNQIGQMRKAENLKRCDVIDPVFVEEYNKLFGVNLRETWVDDDFVNLLVFQDEKPKELGRQIEEKLEPYLEEKRKHVEDENYACNAEYEKCLLTIVHHLEHREWRDYFDHFVSRLHEISFELGSKTQKEALYTIKMNISDEKTLQDIAFLSQNPELVTILQCAKEQIEIEKEQLRQFQFTYAIGKQIENAIRNEVSSELSIEFCEDPERVSAKDEQRGQDIIIRDHEGKEIYYIECKAKWEFHDSKAHMSSLQIKQAVKNQDKYALLCVDCTRDTGAKIDKNASPKEIADSIQEVLLHTTAHCDIGKSFSAPIGSLVKYEEDMKDKDGEKNIKLNSTIGCDIPKSVFNDGISFDEFMCYLKNLLRKDTKIIN